MLQKSALASLYSSEGSVMEVHVHACMEFYVHLHLYYVMYPHKHVLPDIV